MSDFTSLFSKVLIFLIYFQVLNAKRYDGYQVYDVEINNEKQLNILKGFEQLYEQYRFWEPPAKVGLNVVVAVNPNSLENFQQIIEIENIKGNLIFADLQRIIDEERKTVVYKNFNDDLTWDRYYRLDAIQNWLRKMAKSHSDIVTLKEIGKSYENRSMLAFEIIHDKRNPSIFIECHIHAREWITSATVTWIINEILTSKDPQVVKFAKSLNWYIIPNMNPDGFEYSHTNDRMWRKTRTPQSNGCDGVDGNRNFPYAWKEQGGASSSPCSETYAGPYPESEVEIKAMTDYYAKVSSKINAFFSFHSFSQLLLFPYGIKTEGAQNEKDLRELGYLTAQALSKRYKTQYKVGSTLELLYPASGISVDWAYAVHKTPLSYTYEFRDKGKYGFLLPADQILPNAEETLDSLIEFHSEAKKRGYFNRRQ